MDLTQFHLNTSLEDSLLGILAMSRSANLHSSSLITGVSIADYYNVDLAYNMTGRLFEAFTNKTFSNDYTITVYQGYSGDVIGKPAYEKLDFFNGGGDYYTGFYELQDLTPGSYVAIAES